MYETIADFYDSEFRGWNEDFHFFLKQLKPGSRILELGSGAGRIAIPLAQNGHCVTGIEISGGMLEIARATVAKLPFEIQKNIKWLPGDFLNLDLPETFDCVLAPFSALNFFIDDQAHIPLFRNLHDRLNSSSMLIADIIFEKENTPSRKKESEKSFCHCVRGTLIKKKSVETPAGKHLVSVLQTYEERDYLSGELIAREENAITLYVFPPDEMVQKLESVGFAVEKIFGNYHQAPFDKNKSARMLIVARRS